MGKTTVVEKIVQSLSFEVEAVPQKFNQAASSSDHTPVNVKIRVRKRDEAPIQCGVISVPNVKTPVERIRLISSDQTIMSFDLQMEDENDKKPLRKPRRRIFDILKPGGCFSTENDEDEYPYLPATSYNANLIKGSFNSNSDGTIKQNFTLSRRNYEDTQIIDRQKNINFLGKCKPGGCLDPPFSEEKYSYKLASKKQSILNSTVKEENENSKIDTEYKSKVLDDDKDLKKKKIDNNLNLSKDSSKRETKTNSVLSLYKAESLQTSITMSYSNSIITYPPELTSSQMHLNEEKNVKKRESDDRSRNSFIEFTDIYFPPKNSTNRKIATNSSVPEHSASKELRRSFDESKKNNNKLNERKLFELDRTIDKEFGPVKENEKTEDELREIKDRFSKLGYTQVKRKQNIPFILPNITVHPINAASTTDKFLDTQTDTTKNIEKRETKQPSLIKLGSKIKFEVPILNTSEEDKNAESHVLQISTTYNRTKEKNQESESLEIEQVKSFENVINKTVAKYVKSSDSIEVKEDDDKRVNDNLNNTYPHKIANDSDHILNIHSEILTQTLSKNNKFEPELHSSQNIDLESLVKPTAITKNVNDSEDIKISQTKLKNCDNTSLISFNEINLQKDQDIEVLNAISLQTKQIDVESSVHTNKSDASSINNLVVQFSTEPMVKFQDKYPSHQIIHNKEAELKDKLNNYKTIETLPHKSKRNIINNDVDVQHKDSIITSNTISSITRKDLPPKNQSLELDKKESFQEVLSKRQSIPCKNDKNMKDLERHTAENPDKIKISASQQKIAELYHDEEILIINDQPFKNISHEDRIMNLKNNINSENIEDTTFETMLDGGFRSSNDYKKNIPIYEKVSLKECTSNNIKAKDMSNDDDDYNKVTVNDIINNVDRSQLVKSNESEAIDSFFIDKVSSSFNIIPNSEAECYSQVQIKNKLDSLDNMKIEILENKDMSRTSTIHADVLADEISVKNETTSFIERTKNMAIKVVEHDYTPNDVIIETIKSYDKTDNSLQNNKTDDLKSPLYFNKKTFVSENLSNKRQGENADFNVIENKGLNKNKEINVHGQDTPNNLIMETINSYDKTDNFAQNLTNDLNSPFYLKSKSIMSENLSNIRHDKNFNLDIIENKGINKNEEIKLDNHDTPNNLTRETIKSYDKTDNYLQNITDDLNSPNNGINKNEEIKLDNHDTPNNLTKETIKSYDKTDNYLENITDDLNSPNNEINKNQEKKIDNHDTPNNLTIETIKSYDRTDNYLQNITDDLNSALHLKNKSIVSENLSNKKHGENADLDIIENEWQTKNKEIKVDGTNTPNKLIIETIKSYDKIIDNYLQDLTDDLNSPLYFKNKSILSENLSNERHEENGDFDIIENKLLNKNEQIKVDGHETPNNIILETIKSNNYLQNITDNLKNPLYFENKSIVSENLSNRRYAEDMETKKVEYTDLDIFENKELNKNEEIKGDYQDTPNNLIIESIQSNDIDNVSQNFANDLNSPVYFDKKTTLNESPSSKRYDENSGILRSALVSTNENKRLNKSEDLITTYKIDSTDRMENLKDSNFSHEKKSTTESVLAKGELSNIVRQHILYPDVNQQDYSKHDYTPLSLKDKIETNHEISETFTFSRDLSNSISNAPKVRKSSNDFKRITDDKVIEPSSSSYNELKDIFVDHYSKIVEPNISVTETKEFPDGKFTLLKALDENKINSSRVKYSKGYDERSLTSYLSKPTTKILNKDIKNNKMYVDLAFQTFSNDKNEIVIKTFDSVNEPVRYQDDHLTIIKSQMRLTDTELRIPINTENYMSIKLMNTNIFNRDPQANDISNNGYHPTAVSINLDKECANQNISVKNGDESKSDENKHNTLITIYEQELVPLQKVIKSLKDDIDSLSDQQIFLKDKLFNPRRSKIKLMHFNRKCGCLKRY